MMIDEAIAQVRKRIGEKKKYVENHCVTQEFYTDIECYEQLAEWLEECKQYRAIGTVEDVIFYKKCYDEESYEFCGEYGTDTCGCKGRMEYLKKENQEIRAKTIDEAIEKAAKAICIDCGSLEGNKCTYKGSNCRVSMSMLGVVVKALEQMKGDGIDG